MSGAGWFIVGGVLGAVLAWSGVLSPVFEAVSELWAGLV